MKTEDIQSLAGHAAAIVLRGILAHLVVGNLVWRTYEPELAEAGDTVNVPILPFLSSNNGDECPPGSLGNAQMELRHIESALMIPNGVEALAFAELLEILLAPAAIALAEYIDQALLHLYGGFTANTPCGAAGAGLSEAVVDAAETALFHGKVPKSRPKYLIIDPVEFKRLREHLRFDQFDNADEQAAHLQAHIGDRAGVGQMKGLYIVRSPLVVKSILDEELAATHNIAFASSAMGLVTRKLPQPKPNSGVIVYYAQLDGFGCRVVCPIDTTPGQTLASQLITVEVLFGVGVLRNDFGVQVES